MGYNQFSFLLSHSCDECCKRILCQTEEKQKHKFSDTVPIILSALQTQIFDDKINLPNIFKLRKIKIELLTASLDFYVTWTCICTYTCFTHTSQACNWIDLRSFQLIRQLL